jgi:TorA maturation chaperone TorD
MESVMENRDAPAGFAPYANIRTDGYVMMASLLGQPPSADLRTILQNLQWDEAIPEQLGHALTALRQACHDYLLAAMKGEFDGLFVGLGCGEMIPYASWYREKMIQSMPLVSLRSDLVRLGIVRQSENHETEDHAAALCEVMAILSQESNGCSYGSQAHFFQQHIASWMGRFFKDLQSAKSAGFYRSVGLFGSSFLEFECRYLGCHLNPIPNKKRRRKARCNGNFPATGGCF